MPKAEGHTAYEVAGTNQVWLTAFPLDTEAGDKAKAAAGTWAVCKACRGCPGRTIITVILQAWSTDLQCPQRPLRGVRKVKAIFIILRSFLPFPP